MQKTKKKNITHKSTWPLYFVPFFLYKRKQSPRSAVLAGSADVIKATFHFANHLRLMSVCLVLSANSPPSKHTHTLGSNLCFITVAPVKTETGKKKSLFVIKPRRLACCWCLEAKLFEKSRIVQNIWEQSLIKQDHSEICDH